MGLPKQERSLPTQGPGTFGRLAQGGEARRDMLRRARAGVLPGAPPAGVNLTHPEGVNQGGVEKLSEEGIVPVEPLAPPNSLPHRVARRLGVVTLPIAGFLALNVVACGEATAGGKPPEAPPPIIREVLATNTPEVIPTPTLTPKPEPSPTPKPEPTPEVKMPELIPLAQIPGKIDELVASVNGIEKPLDPRMTQRTFESSKTTIKMEMDRIKQALANNDLEMARKILLDVKGPFIGLSDPSKAIDIPENIFREHDPKGRIIPAAVVNNRLIVRDSIDPRLMSQYLKLVKIGISFDAEYLAAAGKR